jgi:hypothetical protein
MDARAVCQPVERFVGVLEVDAPPLAATSDSPLSGALRAPNSKGKERLPMRAAR